MASQVKEIPHVLNPWSESQLPVRLYLFNYTVAGEKQTNCYVMPWNQFEWDWGKVDQYADAIIKLGMASGYHVIRSTTEFALTLR